ncbi:hypothetical protein NQ317_001044 [Molorchus minor]|uniref:Uncharacterized protein n=1 Tax=Molorchus minor TaxID=1323400 RepID=A0ABQ9IV36_9CUCU|nr:hypothetical protein NQ317_001044 [Molorchus minor]
MDQKFIYAFRGWIAFVAFVDLGTAVRSYIEKRSFLSKTISDVDEYIDEEYTTSRILGLYSILKALVLIHSTLYIHYKPVVSMGVCSLAVSSNTLFHETIYFRAATLNFYVVFPCILNVITLAGLLYIPHFFKLWETQIENSNENAQLKEGTSKRRRNFGKNN